MGRAKHCTEEKRTLILNLVQRGKTYKFIQEALGCSAKMILNAKKWKERKENRGGKRKTTIREDRNILKLTKANPFMSSSQIRQELSLPISPSTIRKRLIEANLQARRPRKVPLLNKRQVKNRMAFARQHTLWDSTKWRNILWSDESKIVLFDAHGSQQHVRRPPLLDFNPKYTKKTVKHGGSKIMIWGCFSWYGVGPLYKIDGILDADGYVSIMQNVMLPYAEEEMPLRWVYMQDNDPKHASRKAKKWFADNNIRLLVWPAQSPDLNPIEHLWGDIKKAVSAAKPQNNKQLWEVCQEAWKSIPITRCRHLVESMPRRCAAVIANRGQATKY